MPSKKSATIEYISRWKYKVMIGDFMLFGIHESIFAKGKPSRILILFRWIVWEV